MDVTGECMCDELFLMLDSAAHNGYEVDGDEVEDHLQDCTECNVS